MNVLVIIPTYNECNNLPALWGQIRDAIEGVDLLVVDDDSPDGTGAVADAMAAADAHVNVMHRSGKLGLGTAYIAGFRWALERDYTHIFEMDADFSHQPSYLPVLLHASEQADVVLGCRYISGGGTEDWGLWRQFVSRAGNVYARVVLGLSFRDLTGGFKCFRREVLEHLNLDAVHSTGYAFQIELTYRAHLAGFRVVEVPIIFPDRRVGESKMSGNILREAMPNVVKLRLARHRLS